MDIINNLIWYVLPVLGILLWIVGVAFAVFVFIVMLKLNKYLNIKLGEYKK